MVTSVFAIGYLWTVEAAEGIIFRIYHNATIIILGTKKNADLVVNQFNKIIFQF